MKRLTRIERDLYNSFESKFKEVAAEDFLKEVKKGKIRKVLLVTYEISIGQAEDYLYIDENGNKCRVHIYVLFDEPLSWSNSNWTLGDKTEQGIDIQKLKELRELSNQKREELTTPKTDYNPNWFAFAIEVYRIEF